MWFPPGVAFMPKRNIAWVLLIGVIALLMWQMPQTIAGRDAVYRSFGVLADVKAQIERRAVSDIDDDVLTTAAVQSAIRAMIENIDDPYAVYLDPDEYRRFKGRAEGVFGGVGLDVGTVPRGLEVLSRDAGSPAAMADIRPGDLITHADGESLVGRPLVEIVNNVLNGPPGTEVRLTVVRPGDPPSDPRDVTLRRAVIHINVVRGWFPNESGGWRYMLDAERLIGYVRLTKFTEDAADQLDAVVQRLLSAGLRGLVFDLRENTGGLLDSARDVADRFLAEGLIVSVRGRRSDAKAWSAMHDGTYPPFPMAVLINGSTASAAEIVAGALRAHRRARLFGERSYGKGSVQEVIELAGNSGAIKLTTAYYYLPDGRCIHRTPKTEASGQWGVEPNQVIPLTDSQRTAWLETWRKLGREQDERTGRGAGSEASAPASGGRHVRSADESDRLEDLQWILARDVQLRRALEHLQGKDRPREEPPAATTARSSRGPRLAGPGTVGAPG